MQQHNDDVSLFDFEQSLRNDEASFNTVRKLSPTSFRFQILDSHGRAISGRSIDDSQDAPHVDANESAHFDENNSTHFNDKKSVHLNANQSAHHFRDTAKSDGADSNSRADESTCVDSSHAKHADAIQDACSDSSDSKPEHIDRYSNRRCREAIPEAYYRKNTYVHAQGCASAFTYDAPVKYRLNA